jgi:ubiquinone/menaquinone biosynthesis C-methylase UbiE
MSTPNADNVDKTRDFFDKWDSYHETVKNIDTWKLYGEAISKHIKNGTILDVGNGGIFNYDTSAAKKIIALDLSPNLLKNAVQAENIEYVEGNIINLNFKEPEFDQIVMDMLVHHLADKSFRITRENVLKSFKNSHRVLKNGGELIIMESCLPKFFEAAEKMFFPLFRLATSLLKHPVVFQWNWFSIVKMLKESGFKNVTLNEVRLGKWIIHLGFKIPTKLSPVKAFLLIAVK